MELQNNSIRDLSPIKDYANLEYLDLRGNPIENYAGVDQKEIETLYMDSAESAENTETAEGDDSTGITEAAEGDDNTEAAEADDNSTSPDQ